MTRGRQRAIEVVPESPSSSSPYFALYCAAKMALLVAFAPAAAVYVGAVGATAYVGHRLARAEAASGGEGRGARRMERSEAARSLP